MYMEDRKVVSECPGTCGIYTKMRKHQQVFVKNALKKINNEKPYLFETFFPFTFYVFDSIIFIEVLNTIEVINWRLTR